MIYYYYYLLYIRGYGYAANKGCAKHTIPSGRKITTFFAYMQGVFSHIFRLSEVNGRL